MSTRTRTSLTTSLASLTLDHNKENDDNDNHNTDNTNTYTYKNQHYDHGFTNDAMEQLKSSRQLLTTYKERQMKCIDDAMDQTYQAFKSEQNKIQSAMNELRSIQRQRGVDDENEDGSGSSSGDSSSTENQVEKREKLHQRRTEVERNLANLHLKQKQVQKKVMGE